MSVAFFEEGEERALDVLRRAMDKLSYGSETYRKAERGYGFIANKIRQRQKLHQEYERDHRANS